MFRHLSILLRDWCIPAARFEIFVVHDTLNVRIFKRSAFPGLAFWGLGSTDLDLSLLGPVTAKSGSSLAKIVPQHTQGCGTARTAKGSARAWVSFEIIHYVRLSTYRTARKGIHIVSASPIMFMWMTHGTPALPDAVRRDWEGAACHEEPEYCSCAQ